MKFGLEFMTIVSADFVQAKGELLDHVVDKPDGVCLGMFWIDFQGPDAGCIIDCSVLVTLQLMASFIDKCQKLDINLYVMTRNLFLVALVGGDRALATILWQPIQAMTFEHIVNTLTRYFDLVIAFQIPGNSIRAKVVGAPQM